MGFSCEYKPYLKQSGVLNSFLFREYRHVWYQNFQNFMPNLYFALRHLLVYLRSARAQRTWRKYFLQFLKIVSIYYGRKFTGCSTNVANIASKDKINTNKYFIYEICENLTFPECKSSLYFDNLHSIWFISQYSVAMGSCSFKMLP